MAALIFFADGGRFFVTGFVADFEAGFVPEQMTNHRPLLDHSHILQQQDRKNARILHLNPKGELDKALFNRTQDLLKKQRQIHVS